MFHCHNQVNTATEYGALIDNGYVIFNSDTDAQGDEEVGRYEDNKWEQ